MSCEFSAWRPTVRTEIRNKYKIVSEKIFVQYARELGQFLKGLGREKKF